LPRYKLFLVVSPSWLGKGVGDLLLDRLFEDLREANAVTVSCHEHTAKTDLINLLRKRGFKQVDRQLDSRLLIAAAPATELLSTEKLLEKSGITISTLTQMRKKDPGCIEKLYQLSVTLGEEDNALPFKPAAYEAREARMWLDMPYVLPDGYFIATHSDSYVGTVDVNLHDRLPRGVTLNGPGVLREFRRQGIGTALMLNAIAYVKANGYEVIRTFNRPSNKSLLRMLRKMGFKTELDIVTLERFLSTVTKIDPKLYDEYAGTYVAERPQSSLNMKVDNENGHLTLECIGQKVELFPTSETDFFIKMFYGEVSFGRTPEGCVTHLDFSYRSEESLEKYRASKIRETKH